MPRRNPRWNLHSSFIMSFTFQLSPVFSHVFHEAIAFFVGGGGCLFVFTKPCGIQRVGTLPTKASYCLRAPGLCWTCSTSPHVGAYGTSHPESSIQEEFFNKFVQHYTKETLFFKNYSCFSVCWIWKENEVTTLTDVYCFKGSQTSQMTNNTQGNQDIFSSLFFSCWQV